jgi:Protein of unknown function (DUF3105)
MTKPSKPRPKTPAASKSTSGSANAGAKGGTASAAKKPLSPEARRAQSKKIVSKRQTPWGLIITTIVIVALAAGVIGYAVNKSGKKSAASSTTAADKIPGIQHYANLTRNHVSGVVKYAQSPPVGGDHSPVWAPCNGIVYPAQIANENAVHPLEHGAIWITYKPGLDAADLDVLTKLVSGQQYIFMTPYAGLKTNVSLQAWGYQLFVDSASDARVTQFITDLKLNQTNTPELGAACDTTADPSFLTNPSTPGNPIDTAPTS